MKNLQFIPQDTVFLIACSDGIPKDKENSIQKLIHTLEEMGLRVQLASTIYQKRGPFSGRPQERAGELMRGFTDPNIKAIFDVSGGNLCNQVLEYLDYKLIQANAKPFFGMSDLSVLLNVLYCQSGVQTYHYSVRKLNGIDRENQIKRFKNTFIYGGNDIYNYPYKWIQGKQIKGTLIGGNIRCFLKLAGTRYMPSPEGKVLLLESLGGGLTMVASLLTQYKQLGFFDKIKGLILGTFTQYQKEEEEIGLITLVQEVVKKPDLPIIKTEFLGHGEDAYCAIIGKEVDIK